MLAYNFWLTVGDPVHPEGVGWGTRSSVLHTNPEKKQFLYGPGIVHKEVMHRAAQGSTAAQL